MLSGSLAPPTLSGLPFTHPLPHPPFTPPCRSHSFPILIPFTSPPFRSSFPRPCLGAMCVGVFLCILYCPSVPHLHPLSCLDCLPHPCLFNQLSSIYAWDVLILIFLHLSMSNYLLSFLFCSAHAVTLSHAPKLIDIPTYLRSINLPLPLCIPLFLWKPYIKINLSCFRSLSDLSYAPSAAHTSPCIFCVLTAVSHFGLNPSSIFTMVRCCCYIFLLFSLLLWEWVSLTFICAYPSLSSFLSRPLLLFHPASPPPPLSPLLVQLILCFRRFSLLFSLWLSLLLFCWLMTCQRIPLETGAFSLSLLSLFTWLYVVLCTYNKNDVSLSLSLFLTLWFSDFLTHSLYHQLSLYICVYI